MELSPKPNTPRDFGQGTCESRRVQLQGNRLGRIRKSSPLSRSYTRVELGETFGKSDKVDKKGVEWNLSHVNC